MAKISVFKNVSQPENPISYDLVDYLQDTRDGMWEDIVMKCRSIKDHDERMEFKKTMPTATLSGEFRYRNEQGLIKHSRVIAMDLDDVSDPRLSQIMLTEDSHVYSVFLSTSGTGLRVLFRILDESQHREYFRTIAKYIYDKYGLVSDPNGISQSKPYCVSFDPLLYINPEIAVPFKKLAKETVIKPLQDFVHTDDDFHQVMKQIVGRGINICEDYNDWLKVGFAISEKYGEDGRQYYHLISQQSQKFNLRQCNLQYTNCLKARGQTKANISTFYYLAKNCNISIASDRTKKIVRATKNGKRSGLKKEQIIENLSKFENITGVDKLVENVFESNTDLKEEDESVLPLLELFISNNFSLQTNEVTEYIENEGIVQKESDLNTIFIAAKKVIPKLDFPLMMRLLKSDFVPTYNPFFRFLGSDGIAVKLPANPIDNEDRFHSPIIDKLSECIINENPAYTLFFTRKWIVSIISAMHKVHSPLLHTLLGAQNTGKTEFYRRLLPAELKPYYAESKLDKGKDDELLMCQNILIMDDELSGKSKADTIKLNGVTSSDWFSLRAPYGSKNEKFLRYAVLCGTSNYPKGVLADPTGNRRIIPIDVHRINQDMYNGIDKVKLFHEAFRLYKEGFDWRVTAKDIPYLNADSEKYQVIVKERELVEKYYYPDDKFRLSTTEVLVEIEILTHQKLNINALGRVMDDLGFEKKSTRINAFTTVRKWCVGRTLSEESIKFKEDAEKDEDAPF